MVKTKIIATLGPAASSRPVLRKMMLAGLDVARINFSHGNLREHLKRVSLIRELNSKYRRRIKVLGDLEGYRIRIGRLKEPIELKKNQVVSLPVDYKGDLREIAPGRHIYIDDGNLDLVVERHERRCLRARVVTGGLLKERKGVNIPGARLKFRGITEKDRRDISICIKHKFDYIAQSFVRTKEDILKIRALINGSLPECKIIAKIESREGIKKIDEIIAASDGIMIARGDMGVSIPIYEVPIVQKEIIRKCRRARKFAITATQMLESMTTNPRPTRAEASDVANAIIDGSHYLMLSAETSIGAHPVEAVKTMNQIIKFTEAYLKK